VSEAVFHKIQLGAQAGHGTAVAATTVFPVEPGVVFDLDRATQSPNEDYGRISRHQPGRSSHGMRGASATLSGEARFEDVYHLLEMHVAGGGGGTAAGTATYTFDETSDTLTRYTVEGGTSTTEDQWEISDALADTLELGFDALTAPGNSPWTFSAGLLGKDRATAALTGSLTAPTTLETIEGHLTRLYEGPVGTAFADLTELSASLGSYQMTSASNLVMRAYGGTVDTFSGWGRSDKAEVTFNAMVKVGATSDSNIHDIWNVASGLATERRWRIQVVSGSKTFRIDARVNFTTVGIGDRDGERMYQVEGYFVYDPTLASRGQIVVIR
jgi:hypothetical protein